MKRFLVATVMVGLIAMTHRAHAGACASMTWKAVILNPTNTALPKDGAIVVGVKATHGVKEVPSTNPAVRTWRLGTGDKAVVLTSRPIAPGLALYNWPAGQTGEQVVTSAENKPVGKISIGAGAATALAAPSVKSVHSYSKKWTTRGGPNEGQNRTSHNVLLRLAATPPAEALGLILYVGDGPRAKPGLFSRVGSTTIDLQMFRSPGRCQPTMRGRISPPKNSKVSAAWVGKNGVISPRSAALVVSGSEPTKAGLSAPANTPPGTAQPPPKKKGCQAGGEGASLGLLLAAALMVICRRRSVRC